MGKRKNIIILGNSGAVIECYMNLQQINGFDVDFCFKGFLSFEGYQADLKSFENS